MQKAYMNWSSGKDSALALFYALGSGLLQVESLFTVVQADGKVAMHNVPQPLLKRQAQAIGIPLALLGMDSRAPAAEYHAALRRQTALFKARGITTALFGDLYLDALRQAREQSCRQSGMSAAFPLWGLSPQEVMARFIDLGFQAVVTCIDNSVLDESLLGSRLDHSFLRRLPQQADPCGENGEYHSFVFDGPIFTRPVPFAPRGSFSLDFPDPDSGRLRRYCYLELA